MKTTFNIAILVICLTVGACAQVPFCSLRSLTKSLGAEAACAYGSNDAGPSPGHTFQEPTAIDSVATVIVLDKSRHVSPP